MIPLYPFLIAWIVLLGIFGFMMALTLIQTLRHGLPGVMTYLTTFLFLAVVALVILGVGGHLTTVNWADSVQLVPKGADAYLIGL